MVAARWMKAMVLAELLACASGAPSGDPAGADQHLTASAPAPERLPPGYEALTADAKLRVLWDERIIPTQYTSTLPAWPFGGFDLLKRLTAADLDVTISRTADEMPMGRPRLVHSLGAVVQVELIPDGGSPYTGMFQGGVGLARLSLARDPGKDAFVPGIAVKLLCDGKPSKNFLAMLSIDGQGANFDFFANPFSNVIPDAVGIGGKLVASIFAKVSTTPGRLDVSDFATRDRLGREVASPVAPEQLILVPAASVKAVPRRSSPDVDFRLDLAAIPEGTTLYEVLAARKVGQGAARIGRLITRSPVTVSRFGDETLFFKHEAHAGSRPQATNPGDVGGGGGG